MNGAFFVDVLRELTSVRDQPELWWKRKRAFVSSLQSVSMYEEMPAPESHYPSWIRFRDLHKDALQGAHLCGHYFELCDEAWDHAASLYRELTSFVTQSDVSVESLQQWVAQRVDAGHLSKSEPVTVPEWKQQQLPGITPYYIRCVVELGESVKVRAGLAKPEDVQLIKRHNGEQLNFATPVDKVVERFTSSTFLLTLWVLVDEEKPQYPTVRFGTGYMGSMFPPEQGSILSALCNPDLSKEVLDERIHLFLEAIDNQGLMFTLLPPK